MRQITRQLLWQSDLFNTGLIVAIWSAMLLIANPSGNFPLNDDWNYARSVLTLLQSGKLEFTCWNCSSNVLQILYGAVITKVFGFSFLTLRVSTWLCGLIAGIFMYLLVKLVSARPLLSLVAAMTLMTNVIYFNLSSTFMTDVPFMAMLMASSYYSVKSIQYGRLGDFLMAVVTAMVATFIRQYGIVILLCFLVTYAYKKRFEAKTIAVSVALLAFAACLLWWLRQWLLISGLPGCYTVWMTYLQQFLAQGPGSIAKAMLQTLIIQLVYLGLFVLPLSFVVIPLLFARFNNKERIFALILTGELAACFMVGLSCMQVSMPLTTNVLFDSGAGPVLLAEVSGAPVWISLGKGFWTGITAMSCLGVGIVGAMIITERLNRKRLGVPEQIALGANNNRAVRILVLSFFVTYVAIISFSGLIDRYMLPALPSLCVLLVLLPGAPQQNNVPMARTLTLISFTLLLLQGYFCIATTHDYFAWNRARWQALNQVMCGLKVPASLVDGGWEFNGWMSYEPKLRSDVPITALSMRHGNEYAVTLGPVSGYRAIGSWPFKRWLPPGDASIFLLQRDCKLN